MKKIILSILLSFIGMSMFAQTLLQQDFSAGTWPPAGWTVLGNQTNWALSQTNLAGGIIPEGKVKNSPAFNGTMRFISPAVNTTGLSVVIIQFKHLFDHTDGTSTAFTLGVATRTGAAGTWNNVWTVAATDDIDAETVTIPVSNSDVGASNFQFCLYVTGSSTNFKSWNFDDIFLLDPLPVDGGMAAITIPSSFAGSHILEGAFVNVGETPITSISVNWMAIEGQVHTDNLTGLNVTTGLNYQFTFTDSVNIAPGAYDLKVWISGVNGLTVPDDNPANDTMVKSIAIPVFMTMRRPMFEEFTSSTCGPCANFNNNTFNPFIAQHGEEITLVKYQMNWPGSGDPYYTAEGGVRRNYYGVNAVPDLFCDGKNTNTSSSAVNTAFNNSMNTITYIEIESQHEIQGSNIIINANIIPYANYPNVTVYVTVVERVTTGNVATNGETEFHNVMMKMLPDASGTSANLMANQPLNLQFTQNMSGTFVEEMDDLRVAIWIQDNSTKEIYQSNYSVETGSMMTMTPPDGATNVSISAPLLVQFHQAVRMVGGAALTNSNVASVITLKEGGPLGPDVDFTATINTAKTLITVTPANNLKSLQPYYFKIDQLENNQGVPTLVGISNFTTEFSTVGVEKPKSATTRVYPNPAKDVINIEISDFTDINRIELVNSIGKTVRVIDNASEIGRFSSINVSSLPAGLYYLRLDGNKTQQTLRVLISR
jgi:hypothetical protein